MKKMRRTVPWAVALFLLFVGTAMGAAAMGGTPQSSVISDLAQWIVGNVLALCGVFVAATRATQVWLKGHVAAMLEHHDCGEGAHRAASAHNHGPMTAQMDRIEHALDGIRRDVSSLVEGQRQAVEELDEQDVRLGSVEKSIAQLLTEHCLLHGQMLRHREADPAGLDPLEMRGPK